MTSPLPDGSLGFFPAPWRALAWERTATPFDVIVVGGGITGAGIARDAALRGMRVALFDRSDFGSGTSSRSSRLVHGGVRYLEHGHLHLVLESSRERRRLLKIAPHLVRPLAFTWPVYAGARVPLWKLRVGLTLYDALALFRNVARHRRVAPGEMRFMEPQLRRHGLVGAAQYYDAAADDVRLVLANIVAAAEQGSTVLNYATVERVTAQREAPSAWEIEVRDVVTDTVHRVQGRAVVFALGPWSDKVPEIIGLETPKARVVPSVGAHIAIDNGRVGNRGALTLTAPSDGRVFFVLPADDLTIVTTTEALSQTAPEEARATRADVQYLLSAVKHYFPNSRVGLDDVVAAWAGVRPLAVPNGVGTDLSSASREHTISEPEPKLYVVTGGKLTTFRAMAEEVVDMVAHALLPRFKRAVTQHVPLPGGDIGDVTQATENVARVVGDHGLADRLVSAYGSRWPRVWNASRAVKGDAHGLFADEPYVEREVTYAIEHEFAVTLADVLVRRIPLAFEERDHAVDVAVRLAEALSKTFSWSTSDIDQAVEQYHKAVERQFSIDDR